MDQANNQILHQMEAEVARRRAAQVIDQWYPAGSPTTSPASSAASEGDWRSPFEAFDSHWHPDATSACAAVREWVYQVSSGQARGLVLWSNSHSRQTGYGTGKSTLAAMAHETLRSMRDYRGLAQRATFINAADLFGDIKDAYSKNAPVAPLFDDWTSGHLLIDDWGKQYVSATGSEWGREQFYRLIDHTVRHGHGLLLTSNCGPEEIQAEIGGASWSRLLGLCGPHGFIDLSAVPDYRLKIGGFVG